MRQVRGDSAMKFKCLLGCTAMLPLFAWSAGSARQDLATVLAGKPDVDHGAELFGQCAVCHGPQGAGQLDGSVPRIAGQHYRVLARQIVDFRHGARWDFRMEGCGHEPRCCPGSGHHRCGLVREHARWRWRARFGRWSACSTRRSRSMTPVVLMSRCAGRGQRREGNPQARRPARRVSRAPDLRCRGWPPATLDENAWQALSRRSSSRKSSA